MQQVEEKILAHLIRDEDYTKQVLPFIDDEYFTTPANQMVFKVVKEFVSKYKTIPTFDAVELSVEQSKESAGLYKEASKLVKELRGVERVDTARLKWLVDETEKFIKNRALFIAIAKGLELIDAEGAETAGAVPDMLRKALAVGFHNDIGHDYLTDAERRYDYYHQKHDRIPFDLDMFNTITEGGLLPKTLNVCAAGTNVGKSLFLCHVAAAAIQMGKRVLYITMEMAEERIAQRIDANLLDVGMHDLHDLSKPQFVKLMDGIRRRNSIGQLVIKEYPTSTAHAGHFRALMNELQMKKGFVPDILIVDYINICSSERFKMGGSTNSYTYVKSIAEELRGLAVEMNIPLLTATQFNREGFDSSDPSLTNTSESFGLPQTADLQFALISSEELDEDGLLMVKQMKSRYSDMSRYRKFVVGLDRSKMRLFNAPQSYLADSGQTAPARPSTYADPLPPPGFEGFTGLTGRGRARLGDGVVNMSEPVPHIPDDNF